MNHRLAAVIVALAALVFAGVKDPFVQFTQADYCDPHGSRPDQWESTEGNHVNTISAQIITLDVHAGTDVWLSNYVRSWYEAIPDLHGNVYDMGAQRYGYIFANDINGLSATDYEGSIHWGTGDTTQITYVYDQDPSITNTATGYFLGHFNDDAEIYLVMTTLPEDGGELVDSYQYVQDDDHVTTLMSRQHNTTDLAGNVRINFGIDNGTYGDGAGIGREFVAVYDHPAGIDGGHGTTGGPLPGPMTAAAVVACMAALNSARRRRQ